jgi:hypothetical protein
MTVQTETASTAEPAGEAKQTATAQDGAAGDGTGQATDAQGADEERDGELPDWARKRLTRANAEAANYRTKLRDAEARLGQAKTVEDFEAATKDLRETNKRLERQLLVSDVARKHGLPDDLAARLQGSTKEELEADAKALQKYAAPAPPVSLSGGLDPNDDSDPFDPVKAARAARTTRY